MRNLKDDYPDLIIFDELHAHGPPIEPTPPKVPLPPPSGIRPVTIPLGFFWIPRWLLRLLRAKW